MYEGIEQVEGWAMAKYRVFEVDLEGKKKTLEIVELKIENAHY